MGIPLFTSATSHLKFAHERCVTSSEHEGTLEQKLNLHQVGDPIKRHTDLFKYGYICRMCRAHHFRWKGQCPTEIQPLNTPHDRRYCRQAMTPFWCCPIDTLCFPKKTAACTFDTGGGGNSDTCHQYYVVTWQRRLRLLLIQALICFWLFIRRCLQTSEPHDQTQYSLSPTKHKQTIGR